MIVPAVLQQHVDDAALMGASRMVLAEAPHSRLGRLDEFDQRLSAHLDGLQLSGEEAWALCESALETPSPGVVFATAVGALRDRNDARLTRILALTQAIPDVGSGLLAALEWVEPTRLQGTVSSLLNDRDGFRRAVGVAACAMHRVDPGLVSRELLSDADPGVRSRSLKAAGELGLSEAMPWCVAAFSDENEDCRFWSAWSAALLGDRSRAVDSLTQCGLSPGAHRARAFRFAVQVMGTGAAHGVLQQLAKNPQDTRWLIQGSGIAGDPAYIPWLIRKMGELRTARLAGEAFSTIVGVRLGQEALDRPAPENFESGPNDDPDDPNVEMDPDDGLSWPDVVKIQKWWAANSSRFMSGTRYFMGASVTPEHCIQVLKNGYQRQRVLAAHYLCLLNPGTPLFNTSAPARRQQALLAQMS